MQERRYRMEEEMAAQGRVKIYEEENINQKKPLEAPAMADIKEGDSKYSVITWSIWIKMENNMHYTIPE